MSLGVKDGGKTVKQIDHPSPKRPLRSIFFCNTAVRAEGPTWRGQGSGWRASLQGKGQQGQRPEAGGADTGDSLRVREPASPSKATECGVTSGLGSPGQSAW